MFKVEGKRSLRTKSGVPLNMRGVIFNKDLHVIEGGGDHLLVDLDLGMFAENAALGLREVTKNALPDRADLRLQPGAFFTIELAEGVKVRKHPRLRYVTFKCISNKRLLIS